MGLKGWTAGELEELLEFNERTQACHFKRRNSRLGEFFSMFCMMNYMPCEKFDEWNATVSAFL